MDNARMNLSRSGRLGVSAKLPVGKIWPTPKEMNVIRQEADQHLVTGVQWQTRPFEFQALLAAMEPAKLDLKS
jgi:hypothetical protein